MKKVAALLFTCILMQQSLAQWEKVYQHPNRRNFTGITFVDSLAGYVCGDSGTILKTIDRGQNWNPLNTGSKAMLFSIDFSSLNNGVAVGDTGLILRTTNAGSSWEQINVGFKKRQLAKVKFTSPDTGYIAGDSAAILKTTDGGQTWSQPQPMPSAVQPWAKFLGFHFVNNNLGFGCGGSFGDNRKTLFVKTTNGGISWDTMASSLPSFRTGLWDVSFSSPSVGYSTGIFGIVMKTTDGGDSWLTVREMGGNYNRAMHIMNDSTGWVVGSLTGGLSFGDGVIKSTFDGGVFWNVESWPTLGLDWTNQGAARLTCVTTVKHDNTYTAFAVGREGVIIKSNYITSNAQLFSNPAEIDLFPNPAKDEIEIRLTGASGIISTKCFNALGKEMKIPVTEVRSNPNIRFDIHSLPTGIYSICCTKGQKSWVKRFVKQ